MGTVKMAKSKFAWLGRLLEGAKGMIAAGGIERWVVTEVRAAVMVETEV